MKKLGTPLASLALVLTLTSLAQAVVVIDFGTGTMGSGGTITIAGGQATGVGIPVDVLTVNGTAFDGVYDTQGTATGSGATATNPNAAALSFNTATNTITVIGGISSLSIPLGTVLLSGSFDSVSLLNGGVVGSLTASGPDAKSPLLLAALNVPADAKFQFYGFSIGFNLKNTGSPYTAISTDIINTADVNTSTPEPSSFLLLGSGLVGLGVMRHRRRQGKRV